MSGEDLTELLDNVPHTSNEQELCFNASDEIQWLRRWKKWGLHIAVCPNWKIRTCWGCVAPDLQDKAKRYGTAEIIKRETPRHEW